MKFSLVSINLSPQKGGRKSPVSEAELLPGLGLKGDGHAAPGERQVSLLAQEAIDTMIARGLQLSPGDFAENFTTRGVDWSTCRVGDHLRIGAAELEISRIGKECHQRCAIYEAAGDCIMPRQGVFARVLRGGIINVASSCHYGI